MYIKKLDSQSNNLLFGLTSQESRIFKKLNTPAKIQDYLEKMPMNKELRGMTLMSPRRVLQEKKAHCIEGALFAAAILWFHRKSPILLDLRANPYDHDHVVALFQHYGRWGAISKTNHAVLRYREPVYKNIRELALSYFHEYTDDDGQKSLRYFSKKPFDLRKFKNRNWITDEKDLWYIEKALDRAPHEKILPKGLKKLRTIDPIENKAGKLVQWM